MAVETWTFPSLSLPREQMDPTPVGEMPRRILPTASDKRKQYPMATGLLDYFPDALAEVSRVSWIGNQKHNPGEPLHHARGKSMDHDDCIIRHTIDRGGVEVVTIGEKSYVIRHSAARAWRALAALQEELEQDMELTLPRAARLSGTQPEDGHFIGSGAPQ